MTRLRLFRVFIGTTGSAILCLLFIPSAFANLLTNPGAETGDMTGWTIVDNGGNGWAVGFDNFVRSGDYSFATSFGWNTRYQTVSLLSEGHTEAQLDTGDVRITFSEWVGTRGDKGGQYYMVFKLLGADADPTNPIATYLIASKASPHILSAGTAFFEVSHTFSSYGPGVRYAYFEDGGRDSQDPGWGGNYGTHFDDASITIVDAPSTATTAPVQSKGGHRGQTGNQRIYDALLLRSISFNNPKPSAPAQETPPIPFAVGGSSLQQRTCARVRKEQERSERMFKALNDRLHKRFGFMCGR